MKLILNFNRILTNKTPVCPGGSGFVLLKIDLTRSRVVEESEVIDNRITCCSHVSQLKPDNLSPGFLLLGEC